MVQRVGVRIDRDLLTWASAGFDGGSGSPPFKILGAWDRSMLESLDLDEV